MFHNDEGCRVGIVSLSIRLTMHIRTILMTCVDPAGMLKREHARWKAKVL